VANPTFTYTAGSGTDKDKLRLLIPDRPVKGRAPEARFSDQELTDFLSMGVTLFESAALACEVVAMDETKRMMSVSVNSGMSISRSGSPAFWLQRAKALRENELKTPWEYIDSVGYEIDGFGRDHSEYLDDE
jgi:hypothetical protein